MYSIFCRQLPAKIDHYDEYIHREISTNHYHQDRLLHSKIKKKLIMIIEFKNVKTHYLKHYGIKKID